MPTHHDGLVGAYGNFCVRIDACKGGMGAHDRTVEACVCVRACVCV